MTRIKAGRRSACRSAAAYLPKHDAFVVQRGPSWSRATKPQHSRSPPFDQRLRMQLFLRLHPHSTRNCQPVSVPPDALVRHRHLSPGRCSLAQETLFLDPCWRFRWSCCSLAPVVGAPLRPAK